MKLYYDFHIHSALSPCSDDDMTPCNIVGMAHIKGLSAIAVTDHNTVGNVAAAMAVGKQLGVVVVPGMEVETSEEVHVLTLFSSLEAAQYAAEAVRSSMPEIDNNEEIFGRQLLIDENDVVTGVEKQMLITASGLDIYDVFKLVDQCGGVAVPAHVDKHSNSILSNLGFIPPDLTVSAIELSRNVGDPQQYIMNKKLQNFKVMRNSDAHQLGDISEKVNCFDTIDNYLTSIIEKFM